MITPNSIITNAVHTLQLEADAILALKAHINSDFVAVVERIYQSKGRVIVSGIGKSAIIAQKIVATFNSTGTPAIFMHAADAIHGDLGMIQQDDVIICISKSGDTPEIKVLVPLLKKGGNVLVGMAGNDQSFLAKNADYLLNTTVAKEACPNNLAPTTSTTAQLAMGDALAVCLLECREFTKEDFARYHPGGALGKRLYLRVLDVATQHEAPKVLESDSLKTVILEITSKRLGATAVVTTKGEIAGVITDGDLRRMLEKGTNIEGLTAKDIMGLHPKTIEADALAVDALLLMQEHSISQLLAVQQKKYIGIIHLHDLIREGIV